MMWSYDHVAAACAVVTLFYHRQRHRHHRQDYKCVQQLLVKLLGSRRSHSCRIPHLFRYLRRLQQHKYIKSR